MYNIRKFTANFQSVLRSSSGNSERERKGKLGNETGGRGGDKRLVWRGEGKIKERKEERETEWMTIQGAPEGGQKEHIIAEGNSY